MQITQILTEANPPGNSISAVCRKYSININTFYKWKKKCNNLSLSESRRLKVLEDENNRLKKVLGINVNHKKIYRLYCVLNLQKQKSKSRKNNIYINLKDYKSIKDEYSNHIWTLDFIEIMP